MLTSRRIGRPLEKNETRFTTDDLYASAQPPAFQSSVEAEHFAGGPFVGEACGTKKAAHHSAAKAAVDTEFLNDEHCWVDKPLGRHSHRFSLILARQSRNKHS